ncbi:hypothetical protein XA68_11308 [Ophiocordyceps unilateralis]|uniref:Uncharacterized protein n=1 Tax=Ophiocordyceps unilateralis TaxID=268505 RepID=A0A2A9PH26_OPHUN|nr:hypothetical protein XA68_11308 [Ophiocordyceps unilateralis]
MAADPFPYLVLVSKSHRFRHESIFSSLWSVGALAASSKPAPLWHCTLGRPHRSTLPTSTVGCSPAMTMPQPRRLRHTDAVRQLTWHVPRRWARRPGCGLTCLGLTRYQPAVVETHDRQPTPSRATSTPAPDGGARHGARDNLARLSLAVQ